MTPQHQIATPPVSAPVISVRNRINGIDCPPTVCVQWYGKSETELPSDAQFYFTTLIDPEDHHCQLNPGAFRVAFLGPVAEWPNVNARQSLMDDYGEDGFICWVLSAEHATQHHQRGWIPASFVFTSTLLGDPNCGVIKPVTFFDQNIVDEENQRARDKFMTLADRLAQDMHMELPPEEIPWPEAPSDCKKCEQFEHSFDGSPAIPEGGSVHDLTHVCQQCGRRWWQFNDHFCLWKNVTDPQEWDSIRRQAILMQGGYAEIFDE